MPNPNPSPRDTERNLLFAVFALQLDLIDHGQFVESWNVWTRHRQGVLADLLVERGWLTPADRDDVDRLLERKLKKHEGDIQASLAGLTADYVSQSLAAVPDPGVQRTVADLRRPASSH